MIVEGRPADVPVPDVPASTYLLIAQNPKVTPEAIDAASPASQGYLILCDQDGDSAAIADYVVEQLRSDGHRPFRVTAGKHFSRPREDEAVVAPESVNWRSALRIRLVPNDPPVPTVRLPS